MTSERTCDQCGKHLISKRRGARFCDSDCRNAWHNKQPPESDATSKRLEGVRGPERVPRRASRDGLGTKVYLTPEDIRDLLNHLSPTHYFYSPESEERLRVKFLAAARRAKVAR